MKIYLIRHSDTIEGEKGIILGHLDGTLSKEGILNANKIGRFLKTLDLGIGLIFSSNLKRAIDTSKIINTYFNLEIKKLDILNERGVGINEGKKESEIDWYKYEKKKLAYRKHVGGESFIEVKKRAKLFFGSLLEYNENILIVSHNVFILMFMCFIQGITIKQALQINVKNKLVCVDIKERKINYIDMI